MISDTNDLMLKRAIDEFNLNSEDVIDPDKALETECDILSPCVTLGGIFNEKTIERLRCKIICGATNSQLEEPKRDGYLIFQKRIIYCPDYIVNAGGLINVTDELQEEGYSRSRALEKVEKIYDRTLSILIWSKKLNMPPHRIADLMAETRIEKARLAHRG